MPVELPDPTVPKRNLRTLAVGAGAALLLLGGFALGVSKLTSSPAPVPDNLKCAQPAAIVPDFAAKGVSNSSIFTTPEYEQRSLELLAGAVRIPTVAYDDMSFDVAHEPRFEVFNDLHAYLAAQFPHLAKHRETVNTYGLLYTIKGSDPDLKPVVLMAHQDVVPVEPTTLDQWDHPPFDGVFDGKHLFGRGSCDTKNSLIAIHEAVEALLAQHYTPKRTLLLSFGFDEEIQGFRGARPLAELIEQRYGPDSIEMLIDEGFGLTDTFGSYFATPGVAEKGRVNFRFTLNTPGGHSSAPPDHTGIGIIADLVTRLESDIPLEPSLGPDNVARGTFACQGWYGNDDLDPSLRSLYTNLQTPAVANELAEMLSEDRFTRILVETTQAIDIVRGGVKVNALPEQVVAEVNYRIKPDSSVEAETERVRAFVASVAKDFHLAANYSNAFNPGPNDAPEVILPAHDGAAGFLHLETTDILHVAPVSPYHNDTHWDLLSGTTKHALEDVARGFDKDVVMGPGLMTGNTDTAHYWNLTKNLYRFNPSLSSDLANVHTVNEQLNPRSHYSAVIFFYEFVLNMDKDL